MKHKNQEQLSLEIKKLKVEVGDRYFHYKKPDQFYSIVAVGFMEATEEPCVIYQGEYGKKVAWVRAAKDFLSKVQLPNGTEVDRFTKIK